MDPYLLGLRLGGRRVVVVGGGAVATRRIPALLDAGADIVLVSPPSRRPWRTWPRRAGSAGSRAATLTATAPAPGWSAPAPTTPR